MNNTTGESCWPKTMANPLLMVSRHYVHIYLLVWLPVTVSIEFQLYREHTARPTANRNKQIYKHTWKSVSSMRNLANLASMPYSLSSSPNASKGPVRNRTSLMPQTPISWFITRWCTFIFFANLALSATLASYSVNFT